MRILCTHEYNIPEGAQISEYDFKGKVLKGYIRTMPFEEYLTYVVPKEVSANSHEERLKAQAVAARTCGMKFLLKPAHEEFDLTDLSGYHQAFHMERKHERTDKAIRETVGEVLTYKGKLLKEILYSANNGGTTRLEPIHGRWNVRDIPYYAQKKDAYDNTTKTAHGIGMSQTGAHYRAEAGHSYREILAFYYPNTQITKMTIEKEETDMDIKNELGKIGVRGGHAINDNVLPTQYCYPEYTEGKYVHELSIKLASEFGFTNLEPEEEKLEWATVAKRGQDAGCDTILYNHTNFSINSAGEPNSGKVIIIYPFENEEYQPMYEKMAQIIARHMELPKWETRIRMSTNYENKNYYSAIHYGKKYGIRHPLIVEYGYHVDVAGREEERTQQIIAAFNEMLCVHDDEPSEPSDPSDTTHEETDAIDLVGLRDRLSSVAGMIDELLSLVDQD